MVSSYNLDNMDIKSGEVINSNRCLPSDRVYQLKKELEDLDNKLMSTKSLNLKDINNAIKNHNQNLN